MDGNLLFLPKHDENYCNRSMSMCLSLYDISTHPHKNITTMRSWLPPMLESYTILLYHKFLLMKEIKKYYLVYDFSFI